LDGESNQFINWGPIYGHSSVFQIWKDGNHVINYDLMITDDGTVGYCSQWPGQEGDFTETVENWGHMINKGLQIMDPDTGTPWGVFRSTASYRDTIFNALGALIDGPGMFMGPSADVVTNHGWIDTTYQTQLFKDNPNLSLGLALALEDGSDTYSASAPSVSSWKGGATRYHKDTTSNEYSRAYVDGGAGTDFLYGGGKNDGLLGGAGNDTVSGGAGDDVLSGDGGINRLMGGSGQDVFAFQDRYSSSTRTTITDFTPRFDLIAVNPLIYQAEYLISGLLREDQFHIGERAVTPEQRFILDLDQHRLLYDPDGSGAEEGVLVAYLKGSASLLSQMSARNISVNPDLFY
jgi:Ca2+-binding RTX toxin-like protein